MNNLNIDETYFKKLENRLMNGENICNDYIFSKEYIFNKIHILENKIKEYETKKI